jgi:hypothetical protein
LSSTRKHQALVGFGGHRADLPQRAQLDTAPLTFQAQSTQTRWHTRRDHRAKDGASLEDIKHSGYLTNYVVKLATDAGFRLEQQSEINANPKCTPRASLPPALTLGEKDRAKYVAIGESDRMTLRFVKPASKNKIKRSQPGSSYRGFM